MLRKKKKKIVIKTKYLVIISLGFFRTDPQTSFGGLGAGATPILALGLLIWTKVKERQSWPQPFGTVTKTSS